MKACKAGLSAEWNKRSTRPSAAALLSEAAAGLQLEQKLVEGPQITEHVETTPHPAVATVTVNRHAGNHPVHTQQEVENRLADAFTLKFQMEEKENEHESHPDFLLLAEKRIGVKNLQKICFFFLKQT